MSARPSREHQCENVLRLPEGHAEHDHSSERMSDHRGRQHPFPRGDEGHPVGEGLEPGNRRQSRRATVPGEVRDEQPVAPHQERNELRPVRGGSSEPMDEDQRRALPTHEIAHPDALELGGSLLESGEFCVRHVGRLFLER